jgi:hypothetical protein
MFFSSPVSSFLLLFLIFKFYSKTNPLKLSKLKPTALNSDKKFTLSSHRFLKQLNWRKLLRRMRLIFAMMKRALFSHNEINNLVVSAKCLQQA